MKNGRENRNQWQPRKRLRRKRSTKQVYEVKGDAVSVPQFFCRYESRNIVVVGIPRFARNDKIKDLE
jgi:hypothetical protein